MPTLQSIYLQAEIIDGDTFDRQEQLFEGLYGLPAQLDACGA